mgnify:FL=1
MSRLSAFLNPKASDLEKEVYLSDRFVDDKGKPVPVKIRALLQEESEQLRKSSTHTVKINGETAEKFDVDEYNHKLVLKAVVDPDLSSEEACKQCGVLDPTMVPGRIFLAGEFTKLVKAISDLSGFGDVEADAKN